MSLRHGPRGPPAARDQKRGPHGTSPTPALSIRGRLNYLPWTTLLQETLEQGHKGGIGTMRGHCSILVKALLENRLLESKPNSSYETCVVAAEAPWVWIGLGLVTAQRGG